jgi:hypothetical protein
MNSIDQKFHDDQMRIAGDYAKAIGNIKEEVLSAFIAKYGFEPDRFEMVHQDKPGGGLGWYVHRRTDAEIEACNASQFRYVSALCEANKRLHDKHEALLSHIQKPAPQENPIDYLESTRDWIILMPESLEKQKALDKIEVAMGLLGWVK